MESPVSLQCLKHGLSLKINETDSQYECLSGCVFPVVGEIPRFVAMQNYADSFGLQWNRFRSDQLDSCIGLSISRDRLTRLMGGTLDHLKGKIVLEAGCGAGRFTEVLLIAGADVFAVDLSTAVEANHENCRGYPNYFVCQADISSLPVKAEQFDIVLAIGMVQHTPSPEETIAALCSQVKPGGLLVFDHYTYGYALTLSRRFIRSLLLRRSPEFGFRFCMKLVSIFWPIHRLLWKYRYLRRVDTLRRMFLYVSPVIDYQAAYSELGPDLLRTWALLDTHDTLTDVYKHLRNAEEISNCLQQWQMRDIETVYAGNGVEARAMKPDL